MPRNEGCLKYTNRNSMSEFQLHSKTLIVIYQKHLLNITYCFDHGVVKKVMFYVNY